MRRSLFVGLLVVSLAAATRGQPPSAAVVGPAKTVPEGGAVVLDASASVSPFPLLWSITPDVPLLTVDQPAQVDQPAKRFAVAFAPAAAEYTATVQALGLSEDGKRPLGSARTIRFVVGAGPTTSTDGKPVGPTPPGPAPPAVAGNLRVLILFDPAQSSTLTPAQRGVLFSKSGVSAFLEARCLKEPDGRASWRVWKLDETAAAESAEWRDVLAKAKADGATLPRIAVFAGTALVATRALTTEADAVAFLQAKGGAR